MGDGRIASSNLGQSAERREKQAFNLTASNPLLAGAAATLIVPGARSAACFEALL